MASHDPYRDGFSSDDDDDFTLRLALGQAFSGAADVGEVLAAVGGVKGGHEEEWVAAWTALGDRLTSQAQTSEAGGHRVSAASAYLRAASAYAVPINTVAASGDDERLLATFRRYQHAWDRWVDVVDIDIQRVSIPYEGSHLPGYLFRPATTGPHPMLVAVNGSDGALSSLWGSAVSGALRRGYAALVFDGPGQQSMLIERGVPFRPDWEHVLGPVLDFVLTQPDVDADRVAVYGISQAGFWVPRALAFEHRFAAAVVDPGVVDVSTSWTAHMPKSMMKLLRDGHDEKFDRDLALSFRIARGQAAQWAFRARPYGASSPAATMRAVLAYNLTEVAAQIRTPLLITSPDKEQFWPGQSERLAELTPSVSTLVRFTEDEGASYHCQPMARALTEERMFDWLDDRLAARTAAAPGVA